MPMTVLELQRRLAAAGLDPGPPDGRSGPRTLAALEAWGRPADELPEPAVGPALAWYREHDGCSYDTDRGRYVAALYPHDELRAAREMAAHQSSCGLAMMAAWRAAGRGDPELARPYASQIGRATMIVERVLARAAYQVSSPEPGDVMILAAPWHVGIVDARHGDRVWTIDGGQPDTTGRPTAIRRVARQWPLRRLVSQWRLA